jgi:hypothetical protein
MRSYLHKLNSAFLDFSLCLWTVRHKKYEHTALLTVRYNTHKYSFYNFSIRKTDMRISYGEISCCLMEESCEKINTVYYVNKKVELLVLVRAAHGCANH